MLRIQHIVHPTDFSETSAQALRVAAAVAHDYGARLTLVHVAPPPPVMVAGEIPVMVPPVDAKEHLATLTGQLSALPIGYKDVNVNRQLVEGDPAAEILALADALHADFIVMGTHGRTGLSRLLMGSVAEQVSRKATVPVLLVKEPAKARSATMRPEKARLAEPALTN